MIMVGYLIDWIKKVALALATKERRAKISQREKNRLPVKRLQTKVQKLFTGGREHAKIGKLI